MFKVFFGELEFASGLELEVAIQLALNLHRSSNVPHVIAVFNTENSCSVIRFEVS